MPGESCAPRAMKAKKRRKKPQSRKTARFIVTIRRNRETEYGYWTPGNSVFMAGWSSVAEFKDECVLNREEALECFKTLKKMHKAGRDPKVHPLKFVIQKPLSGQEMRSFLRKKF